MDLGRYKDNPKTAFLAQEYERLLAEEMELRAIDDVELGDLAKDDIDRIDEQKKTLLAQMDKILESEKE